jgi:hypothetical protein
MSEQDKDRFAEYVQASAQEFVIDYVRILNRANRLFLGVSSTQDEDGVMYSVEWVHGGRRHSVDIEWDEAAHAWRPGEIERW